MGHLSSNRIKLFFYPARRDIFVLLKAMPTAGLNMVCELLTPKIAILPWREGKIKAHRELTINIILIWKKEIFLTLEGSERIPNPGKN